ncbi:hypothetical protein OPQ81_010624 [Rhizoctonia solani]|nr:hypothetical protein OPQ81_010624 [Rhizoctonia solani]
MHEPLYRESERVPLPRDSRGAPQAPNEDKEMFRRFARVMCKAQHRDPPAKDSHKAPKTWDGQPNQLPQFLRQLEELFDNYCIKGREHVSTMLEYVDDLAKGMIRELRGFRDHDFDRLKEELKDLMGQPWERTRYCIADLEAMTEEAARHSFKSEWEFHSAYMHFLQILGWLTNAGKLRREERDLCFWNMFSSSMKKQLKARLAVKLPDHPCQEPYPMADVHAATLYLLDNDVFDSKTKGDGRTWLEQERGRQSSAQQDQTLPQYTSHCH